MLLVPRILLHALVVLDVLENHLAEAVKVGDVAHLGVEELGHEGARGGLVVDLCFSVFGDQLGCFVACRYCYNHDGVV